MGLPSSATRPDHGVGDRCECTLATQSQPAMPDQGADAIRQVLPTSFDWTSFCVALILMAVPLAQFEWRPRARAQQLTT